MICVIREILYSCADMGWWCVLTKWLYNHLDLKKYQGYIEMYCCLCSQVLVVKSSGCWFKSRSWYSEFLSKTLNYNCFSLLPVNGYLWGQKWVLCYNYLDALQLYLAAQSVYYPRSRDGINLVEGMNKMAKWLGFIVPLWKYVITIVIIVNQRQSKYGFVSFYTCLFSMPWHKGGLVFIILKSIMKYEISCQRS